MNLMQSHIARRILLSLAYTEQFDFPLTALELYRRLIVGFRILPKDFIKIILLLIDLRLVEYHNKYFFIAGLDSVSVDNLSNTRINRKKFSNQKLLEAQKFVSFAKFVPYISGVAITGSVAVENAVKDDDIDFMIVTVPNRLWITRLIVILYATLRGKRRSFAKEEKNSWCFNLWVEESDLQLPLGSRSIYEAYEVVQAKWLLSKNGIATHFRKINRWTKQKLFASNTNFLPIEQRQIGVNIPFINSLLFLINISCFYFQYLYMKQHMTREKVSRTFAFFHPRDTKSAVNKNWRQTLLRLTLD